MTYETILFSIEGGIARLTLNRPDRLNSFNDQMHREVRAALDEVRASTSVRVLLLTGAGRGFCAGQDLGDRAVAPGGAPVDLGASIERNYKPLVLGLRALELPVVCAVNGVAAGAGVSLACVCDIRIAADSAAFVPGFIGIGLVPDSGGSYFLARLLGPARAFSWMTSNRRLTAAEAHTWGLVDEVVEQDGLAARAAELAADYAARPTRGIAMTKQLFDHAQNATLDEQLAKEAELQDEATKTADFTEGVTAFFEKRPPSFTGR